MDTYKLGKPLLWFSANLWSNYGFKLNLLSLQNKSNFRLPAVSQSLLQIHFKNEIKMLSQGFYCPLLWIPLMGKCLVFELGNFQTVTPTFEMS